MPRRTRIVSRQLGDWITSRMHVSNFCSTNTERPTWDPTLTATPGFRSGRNMSWNMKNVIAQHCTPGGFPIFRMRSATDAGLWRNSCSTPASVSEPSFLLLTTYLILLTQSSILASVSPSPIPNFSLALFRKNQYTQEIPARPQIFPALSHPIVQRNI